MSLTKEQKRQRIKRRVRKIVKGMLESPRLTVFRSNKDIYAQLINDLEGKTIVSSSSREKEIIKLKKNKKEKSK